MDPNSSPAPVSPGSIPPVQPLTPKSTNGSEVGSPRAEHNILSVGDKVFVGSDSTRNGIVAFIGETHFSPGEWIGVALSTPDGKNDGSREGKRYFHCEPLHGIFARRSNVKMLKQNRWEVGGQQHNIVEGDIMSPSSLTRQLTGPKSPQNDSTAVVPSPPPSTAPLPKHRFKVGDRVQVSGSRSGIVRFIGPTEFATGEWAGIELTDPLGKNDGSVHGKRYFSCNPNYGLFATVNKLQPYGTSTPANVVARRSSSGLMCRQSQNRTPIYTGCLTCSPLPPCDVYTMGTSNFVVEHSMPTCWRATVCGRIAVKRNRSQESLLSYSSNLSSVSKSYRAQVNRTGGQYGRTGGGRDSSALNHSLSGDKPSTASSINVLQKVVKEKEAHIEQLLQEREIERSELAKATFDREVTETENLEQRNLIHQLNTQLVEMVNLVQRLREDNERTALKLHEERKVVEDLQFHMAEENIDKTSFDTKTVEDDGKLFELEEALMTARDLNERTEAELKILRSQLATVSKMTDQKPADFATLQAERDRALAELKRSQERSEHLSARLLTMEANLRNSPSSKFAQYMEHPAERPTNEDVDRIAKLEAQLFDTTKQLLQSRDQCQSLEKQLLRANLAAANQLEEFTTRLNEHESKIKETNAVWENRLNELTKSMDGHKSTASITSTEQLVTIRNLEEKLRATEKQLADYQVDLCSDALKHVQHESKHLDAGDSSNDSNYTSPVAAEMQVAADEMTSLEGKLTQKLSSLLRQQSSATASEKTIDEQLQSKLDQALEEIIALRSKFTTTTEQCERLECQLTEIVGKRDELKAGISSVLVQVQQDTEEDVNVPEEVLSSKLSETVQLLLQRVATTEEARGQVEHQLKTLHEERSKLAKELSDAQALVEQQEEQDENIAISEAELEPLRIRLAAAESDAMAAISQLEQKSQELFVIQKQLGEATEMHDQLSITHKTFIQRLEFENQLLKEQMHQAEEKMSELEFKAQKAISPTRNDSVKRMEAEMMATNESLQGEINLLNSIIVDLHKKNADLEERVQNLLLNFEEVPSNPTLDNSLPMRLNRKPLPPPRLWCDNCLVFDSHDTEECDKKEVVIPKKRVAPTVTSDRLYCDICEVFDSHSTEACKDADTY